MSKCWICQGLGIWALAVSALAAEQVSCVQPEVLHVAVIPKNSSSLNEVRQASLLQALREETGLPVQWVPASSYAAVVEGMLAGKAHVAELGPASYVMLRQRSPHFEPFAAFANVHAEAKALAHYHSVLVVPLNSRARNLQDLRGQSVALTDPASTSGSVVPRLAIRQLTGYEAEHFFQRVVYTGAHDKALAALQAGKVQAAFVASHQIDPGAWRVLWRSAALASSPYVWDNHLCPALRAAIQRTFLERPERIQPWLEGKNYKNMVSVSADDYAAIETMVNASASH